MIKFLFTILKNDALLFPIRGCTRMDGQNCDKPQPFFTKPVIYLNSNYSLRNQQVYEENGLLKVNIITYSH